MAENGEINFNPDDLLENLRDKATAKLDQRDRQRTKKFKVSQTAAEGINQTLERKQIQDGRKIKKGGRRCHRYLP